MATKSQRPKTRDEALSSLNAAIDTLNLAGEFSAFAPAKAIFASVGVLLGVIKSSMVNEKYYAELGLNDAEICRALDQGTKGKAPEELSQSVCDAINQLTTTVAGIQKKVTKQSQRSPASRLHHAKTEKEQIAAWKMELNRILHVFNTELGIKDPQETDNKT